MIARTLPAPMHLTLCCAVFWMSLGGACVDGIGGGEKTGKTKAGSETKPGVQPKANTAAVQNATPSANARCPKPVCPKPVCPKPVCPQPVCPQPKVVPTTPLGKAKASASTMYAFADRLMSTLWKYRTKPLKACIESGAITVEYFSAQIAPEMLALQRQRRVMSRADFAALVVYMWSLQSKLNVRAKRIMKDHPELVKHHRCGKVRSRLNSMMPLAPNHDGTGRWSSSDFPGSDIRRWARGIGDKTPPSEVVAAKGGVVRFPDTPLGKAKSGIYKLTLQLLELSAQFMGERTAAVDPCLRGQAYLNKHEQAIMTLIAQVLDDYKNASKTDRNLLSKFAYQLNSSLHYRRRGIQARMYPFVGKDPICIKGRARVMKLLKTLGGG